MKKIVSGIQPSNKLTIGNYIGAIKNFVKLQNDYEMYIFVADLHAITNNFDSSKLMENKRDIVALYIAAGLDINKVKIFNQSDVLHHTDLANVLLCHTTVGELSRMTQYKDKSKKALASNGTEFIPTGLLTYPTLMAADILIYDAELVPTGIDQKQHVELTRDIAIRMNNKYGNIFTVPDSYIDEESNKIMDLLNPELKMSKSSTNANGTIFLLDDPQEAVKKIMTAKTDSLNIVNYDKKNQPGISNLLIIYANLANISVKDLVNKYVGVNYGAFKNDLAQLVKTFLIEIQKKYQLCIRDFSKIEKILKLNATFCTSLTTKKINEVYKKIGIK